VQSYLIDGFSIRLNREGAREYSKVSFPLRYGLFSEIETLDHLFQFNLNGEIKSIQGRTETWPDPFEWLKRTACNDWVYYCAGNYQGVLELFGEYYFPELPYPSNSLFGENSFEKEAVKAAVRSWHLLCRRIAGLSKKDLPKELGDFLTRVAMNDEQRLCHRSEQLHKLIGDRVSVLPPDTRHVDYEVIPIIVADGCLYQCGFCRIKSGQHFTPRSPENITEQLRNAKDFYGPDIRNYNAIFLGQHDGLLVGRETLAFTGQKAYETLEMNESYLKGSRLFIFGSIDSFLRAEERLFQTLGALPFFTCINIGLESADSSTLEALGKPVGVEKVYKAFARMLEINRRYETLEVTANFVYGPDLPESHLSSLLELVCGKGDALPGKGALYLSPLILERPGKRERRELLRKFYKIKARSPLPTYLYLIQRL